MTLTVPFDPFLFLAFSRHVPRLQQLNLEQRTSAEKWGRHVQFWGVRVYPWRGGVPRYVIDEQGYELDEN
jgi:hypothetical protein